MMEAFFFGSSSFPLYGVYYPANIEFDRSEGIVICYPCGQEYMRAHRSFRTLSQALAQKGYHVLRFDYSGTGDSAGNLEETTPNDWLDDIVTAIQELKDVAGIVKVGLLGLRFGGLLAGTVAAERKDINKLILWDTLISGNHLIKELTEQIAVASPLLADSNFVDDQGSIHFNGYCLSIDFQGGLNDLSLLVSKPLHVGRVLQINSHKSCFFDELKNAWNKTPNYQFKHTPAPHDWNYVDLVGSIMIPHAILQAITKWI